MRRTAVVVCGLGIVLLCALYSPPVGAYETLAGRVKLTTRTPFASFATALQQAIAHHKMGLVCHANAQAGAATLGQTIPGNQVLMLYRPDFAIRMLHANVEAGFEAPVRLYIYENPDRTATLIYIKPSTIFTPYKNAQLDQMAAELDSVLEAIVQEAMTAP